MTHHDTHEERMHEAEADDRTMFGFWVYLMTDLLMFAVLFAVYAVLRNNTIGSPPASELLSLNIALANTLILLTSSFTCGIAMLAARNGQKNQTIKWFTITLLLGVVFLGVELYEFYELIHEGHSLTVNAFLSSFFVLVGTHGLHITSAIIWLSVALWFVRKRGLTKPMVRKLSLLSLFWHFLDIVWIFIFTVVYLMAFV
jgi:cytochrome o ubiquinol oxidase subunit 3